MQGGEQGMAAGEQRSEDYPENPCNVDDQSGNRRDGEQTQPSGTPALRKTAREVSSPVFAAASGVISRTK